MKRERTEMTSHKNVTCDMSALKNFNLTSENTLFLLSSFAVFCCHTWLSHNTHHDPLRWQQTKPPQENGLTQIAAAKADAEWFHRAAQGQVMPSLHENSASCCSLYIYIVP
jgi:hypothetical protein